MYTLTVLTTSIFKLPGEPISSKEQSMSQKIDQVLADLLYYVHRNSYSIHMEHNVFASKGLKERALLEENRL